MKVLNFVLFLLILFSFSTVFAQEQNPYVKIEREKLEAIRDWIINAQAYMKTLLEENVKLQAENQALKNQLEREKNGLFIGGNVGYPWGGDAIVMYKLNKNGIYSTVGYHSVFHIDIGFMRRIK